ncbi:MAG: TetR/AcrR family transcriptional regulator C-terminal domain-containing protein [Candidatus Acidiferrales bacterium]
MGTLKAGTQYGDWKGTAAADNADSDAFEGYLESMGLTKDGERLIGVSLGTVGNSVFVRAFFAEGPEDFTELAEALADTKEPIRLRVEDVEITLQQFFGMFKEFEVMLISHELQSTIEGKEYRQIEG